MDYLRTLRKKKGLTQEQLGKRIGVAGNSIGQYENGTRQPSIETLLKLSSFFNVSVDELVGNKKESLELLINIPSDKRDTVIDLLSLSDRQFEKAQAYIAALVDSNEEMKNEIKKYNN